MNKYVSVYILENYKNKTLDKNEIYIPTFYTTYKNETILAYSILNDIYKLYTKKNIQKCDIIKDINNKPIFKDKQLFFNISHSKDFLAVALSNVNIGVDIEQERSINKNSVQKIYNRNDTETNVLKVWNIKEAYSKYIGVGLGLNFSKISINDINKKCKLYTFNGKLNSENSVYFTLCCEKDKLNIITDIKIAKVIDK